MKKYITAVLITIAAISTNAQIELGKWREHLPFRMAFKLEEAGSSIFCLTKSGLFSYSQEDNRIITYNKTNGLSDVGINTIAYSSQKQTLLIGYSNGNVDLLGNDGITNIPDIKQTVLSSSKNINAVLFEDNKALMGTGFGIVSLNLDKFEIADTYYIGENGEALEVNGIVRDDLFYWAATEKGIFRASTSSFNLADFNNWEHLTNLPVNSELECTHIALLEQSILVTAMISETESQIIEYKNGQWNTLKSTLPKITSLRTENGQIWVAAGGELIILNPDGTEKERLKSLGDELLDIKDALETDLGRRYLSDNGRGVIEYSGENIISVIRPDGPSSTDVGDILALNKDIWLVPGGVDAQYINKGKPAEISLFTDNEWINYSGNNIVEFQGIIDFNILAYNPRNENQIYAGSWGNGIFVFEKNGSVQQWNAPNSPSKIAGMVSDFAGNLWVLDAGTQNAIKVKTIENEWISLFYSPISNNLGMRKIITTSIGDKWILPELGDPLIVFNENLNISNTDNYVFKSFFVKDENGQTLTSNVYDIIEDKNENIWAGTNKGIMIYPQPANALRDGVFFAYRPVISTDGQTQYLLETEKINSIAIDGADQKWIGTENSGVFLISPKADQQILHFSTDNSPLLSNKILKIAVVPESGEVFFATDKGIISYKNSVTEGADSFSGLYVYPNPVRENFTGNIIVTGLMTNSIVKITDISGNLVAEGQSSGGQFVWNGKNSSGRRVHTGVYLILCSNPDGSKSKITKLLFIN